MLFLSSSLEQSITNSLNGESDFIVQKIRSGEAVDVHLSWMDEITSIPGVEDVSARYYGRYLLEDGHYFTIVGIDFFEESASKNLQKLFSNIDIKTFLSKDNMIIGEGVYTYMKAHHYDAYFHFYTPTGEKKKVFTYARFPKEENLFASDLVLLSQEMAKDILGIEEESCSDIILNVPNEAERDNVAFKLQSLHTDARIIEKSVLSRAYAKYYNYKSGLFLLLFLLSLTTFMLILYQRYAMVGSSDKKEIAILRMMGWSINDLLKLKIFETLFIALFAFLTGVVLAYFYVFGLDAPGMRYIFLGFGNLTLQPHFQPVIDKGSIASLFLFFVLPFLFAVILPVWRIAITDPYEGMK